MTRLPARERRELARVSLLARDVRWSQQRLVDADLDRHSAQSDQLVDHVGDPDRLAAAEIVNVARDACHQRQAVGADHVARVVEVARDVQVADLQDGLAVARFDLGQLLGEAGDDKARVVARAGVVERPHADHGQLVLGEVLEAHHVLADLADGIRRGGPQRDVFVGRHVFRAHGGRTRRSSRRPARAAAARR